MISALGLIMTKSESYVLQHSKSKILQKCLYKDGILLTDLKKEVILNLTLISMCISYLVTYL